MRAEQSKNGVTEGRATAIATAMQGVELETKVATECVRLIRVYGRQGDAERVRDEIKQARGALLNAMVELEKLDGRI